MAKSSVLPDAQDRLNSLLEFLGINPHIAHSLRMETVLKAIWEKRLALPSGDASDEECREYWALKMLEVPQDQVYLRRLVWLERKPHPFIDGLYFNVEVKLRVQTNLVETNYVEDRD